MTSAAARTATVRKQRDGEDNLAFTFKLRPVDLGPSTDPDADPDERESSCVVEPSEETQPKDPRARNPKRDIALDALREAIAEFGEQLAGTSTIPPGTKAVKLDQWRQRWLLRSGNDYKSPRVAEAAFRAKRSALVAAELVRCSDPWVWIS